MARVALIAHCLLSQNLSQATLALGSPGPGLATVGRIA